MVTVVLLDSGTSSTDDYGVTVRSGIGVTDFRIEKGALDEIGHGTAIASLILKSGKDIPIKVVPVKIYDNILETSAEKFCFALEYIYEQIPCEVLHISSGIGCCDNYKNIYDICQKIYNRGTTIVSAFDNEGAITYPAGFPFVIGVSAENALPNDILEYPNRSLKYVYYNNSIVDIVIKDSFQRVSWLQGKTALVNGSSYVSALITKRICEYIYEKPSISGSDEEIRTEIAKDALVIMDTPEHLTPSHPDALGRFIVFPFNKETEVLFRFENLVKGECIGVYDTKFSLKVGKKVSEIIGNSSKYVIRSYNDIDWEDDFDTVILGHTEEMSKLLGVNIQEHFIRNCILHGKKVYSFDPVNDNNVYERNTIFYPYINERNVPRNRFGKLRVIGKPVLGVWGTSSRQGKFSLQLTVKSFMEKAGYKVGFLSSEPSGYLFGAHYVYPVGYNSTVSISGIESILCINELMWNIESQNPDIIVVGAQSYTVPYKFDNLSDLSLRQYELIYGAAPDAIILTINPHDDINYIKRTVAFLESIIETKVIALVMFPIELTVIEPFHEVKKKLLNSCELQKKQQYVEERLCLPVFSLTDTDQMHDLVDICIDTFGGE